MKNIVLSRLAAAVALSAATLSAGAANLSLVPSQPSLAAGEMLQLELRISALGAGEQLGVFDLDVSFDLSKFGFVSLAFGNALGLIGVDAMDLGSGVSGISGSTVHLSELSLRDDLSSQSSAFTLATLSFSAVGMGPGAFSIANVTLGDAFGNALAATANGVNVQVSAVPEPGSYALLGLGLTAMGLWRRRASRA